MASQQNAACRLSAYLCAFPRRTGEPSCFSRRLPPPAHGLCTCASHIGARRLIAGICAGSAVIASRNCVGRAVLAFHLRLKSRISRSRQMRSWASAASTFMRHRAFNDLQVLSNRPTRVRRFNPALLVSLRRNRDARLRRATVTTAELRIPDALPGGQSRSCRSRVSLLSNHTHTPRNREPAVQEHPPGLWHSRCVHRPADGEQS